MTELEKTYRNIGFIKGLAIGFALGAAFVCALFYFNPLNF